MDVTSDDLLALCRRFHVRRLDLFERKIDLLADTFIENPCVRQEIEAQRTRVYTAG